MTRAAIWGIIIIAATCVFYGMYEARTVLTEVALALMLWLAIESVAEHIRRFLPNGLKAAGTGLAIIGIVAVFGIVLYEVVDNIGNVVEQSDVYEHNLNKLIAQLYQAMNLPVRAPTLDNLLANIRLNTAFGEVAKSARVIAGHTIFILIYLAFLYPAASIMHHKLDRIFPASTERAHVRAVMTAIRASMAQYLWVQTILASLVGVLTYFTLFALGLHNALFWGVLAFFLNFIPTIGPIAAVVLPTLFAVVQHGALLPVAMVWGGLTFWQFSVANFVQPRMMSESLNLSAFVVLLSLAIWGSLWGLTGALLSAPLTVMLMIILAQFESTRWIAILLSADGDPGLPKRPVKQIAPAPASQRA